MAEVAKFPGMRWHPTTGENQVFQSAEDVPEGYLDYHPSNPPEGAEPVKAAPDALPMSREEIVKELSEGGIAFKANAKTEKLYGVLVEAVKAHLTASEIEFPETANGPELLALVPKPE
jgi:hypothetical protein